MGFQNLKVLAFVEPTIFGLNLTPLQRLPHLDILVLLKGRFYAEQLPEGLTYLNMANSYLGLTKAPCSNVLKMLKLFNCSLHGLHGHGIPACTALEELTCMENVVKGSTLDTAHFFNTSLVGFFWAACWHVCPHKPHLHECFSRYD